MMILPIIYGKTVILYRFIVADVKLYEMIACRSDNADTLLTEASSAHMTSKRASIWPVGELDKARFKFKAINGELVSYC